MQINVKNRCSKKTTAISAATTTNYNKKIKIYFQLN